MPSSKIAFGFSFASSAFGPMKIEYSYAKLTKVDAALLQNKSSKYVEAGEATGRAALARAKFTANLIA